MGSAAAAIFAGGLVVVSGHFGSHDRWGGGWRTGNGRPLRVFTVHRTICDALLGSSRLGAAQTCAAAVAGNPNRSRAPHFFPTYLSTTRLLARQHYALVPYVRGYKQKFRRGRQSGSGVGE